jgi:hypothetical protein
MLSRAAGPRLTHLLKLVEKSPRTERWMKEMDEAHVLTWLHCLTASPDLENALGTEERDQPSAWLECWTFLLPTGKAVLIPSSALLMRNSWFLLPQSLPPNETNPTHRTQQVDKKIIITYT